MCRPHEWGFWDATPSLGETCLMATGKQGARSWKSRARQVALHERVVWIRTRLRERQCHLRSAHVQVGGYFKKREVAFQRPEKGDRHLLNKMHSGRLDSGSMAMIRAERVRPFCHMSFSYAL